MQCYMQIKFGLNFFCKASIRVYNVSSILCCHCAFQSFFCNASAFAVDPEDKTVEVNDTDVLLTCMPILDMDQFITWELFLRDGTFWTVTGEASDVDIQLSR